MHGIPGFFAALVLAVALLLTQGFTAAGPGAVTPEAGKEMIRQQEALVILDVRNPNEYVVVHYPGSLNIPVNELEARIAEVPSGAPVLVHCAKGLRAARAYDILKEHRPDIKELYYIKGDPLFDPAQ